MTETAVILVRLPCEYWSATAAQKLTGKVPSADFDIQNGQVLALCRFDWYGEDHLHTEYPRPPVAGGWLIPYSEYRCTR